MSTQLSEAVGTVAVAPPADFDIAGYGIGGASGDPDTYKVDVTVLTMDAAQGVVKTQTYQERVKVDPTCHCRIVELSQTGPKKTLYQGTLVDPLTLPKPPDNPSQTEPSVTTGGCQAAKLLNYFYYARALQSEEGAARYLSADLRKQSEGTKWALNPRKASPFRSYSIRAEGQAP